MAHPEEHLRKELSLELEQAEPLVVPENAPDPRLKLPVKLQTCFSTPEGLEPKTFTFHAPKPNGLTDGAIYMDEKGALWLLKRYYAESAVDAVREVAASHLYRLVVGEHAAPEVQLINQAIPKEWMVASKWCHGLAPFLRESDGIEAMFVASFLIGDRDCIFKNMACKEGAAFRYDFGAALRIEQICEEDLLSIASGYDIIRSTGADPLDILPHIDRAKFLAVLKGLNTVHFDWGYWEKLYDEASIYCQDNPELTGFLSLENQHKRVDEHIRSLMQLVEGSLPFDKKKRSAGDVGFFQQHTSATEAQLHGVDRDAITCELVAFYEAIAVDVHPLRKNYAVIEVQSHLAYLERYGKSPKFFTELVEIADEILKRERFVERLPVFLSIQKINPEHRLFHEKIETFSAPIMARLSVAQNLLF